MNDKHKKYWQSDTAYDGGVPYTQMSVKQLDGESVSAFKLRVACHRLNQTMGCLCRNSIIGNSMNDDIETLKRIQARIDSIYIRYHSPPPIPDDAKIVCQRDDYPGGKE